MKNVGTIFPFMLKNVSSCPAAFSVGILNFKPSKM